MVYKNQWEKTHKERNSNSSTEWVRTLEHYHQQCVKTTTNFVCRLMFAKRVFLLFKHSNKKGFGDWTNKISPTYTYRHNRWQNTIKPTKKINKT